MAPVDRLLQFSPQQIEALGAALWKVLLAGSFVFALVVFREQIRRVIDRLIRLKLRRGDTELLAETPQPEQTPEQAPQRPHFPEKSEPEERPASPRLPGTQDVGELLEAMIDAFLDRRFDDVDTAFQRAQENEPNALNRIRSEAIYWALRYKFAQDPSAVAKL